MQEISLDLKRLRLFQSLTEEEVDRVRRCLSRTEAPAGVIVLQAGTPSSTLYLIQSGTVRVKNEINNQHVMLASLGPFEHFGDMALIDGKGSSATVETTEPCVFWRLERKDFLHLIEDEREIGRKLWRTLAEILNERLRRTTKTLNDYMKINRTLASNETFRELYNLCHS